MKEIWKDIPGYEGLYQVSNWGQVKSLKCGKERILKQSKNSVGYLCVCLFNKRAIKCYTHQLVATAFLGHKPDGLNTVVNHIDNNALNNRVDNLELVSQRYNTSCHKTDPGVCWHNNRNKWLSQIIIKRKTIYLGLYTNKQDALDIYQKAVANIHLYNGDNKEFINLINK